MSNISKIDPLDIARRLGNSIAGDLGANAMVELELAFVSRLLPKFKDNPHVRVIIHILLYWMMGFFKSTLLEIFRLTIPQDLEVADVTSMSRECIFGSTDKYGNPIKPAFVNKAFVIITELLSFLGSALAMRDIVTTMNVAMEGQKVTRRLLKLTQPIYRPTLLSDLKSVGVDWDPIEGVMSYIPNICVLTASTILPEKILLYLNQSGFPDRIHVLQHSFTDEELDKLLFQHHILDQQSLDDLKDVNERLKNVKVFEMNMPSEEYMKPVYEKLKEIVDDEVSINLHLTKDEILNPRTIGDIIRELVAHAFLRTATRNGFTTIEQLEYTEEDRDFILKRLYHFIEFKINPLFHTDRASLRGKRSLVSEAGKEVVLEQLRDGSKKREDLISHVKEVGASKSTLDNVIFPSLVRDNRICKPAYNFYRLKLTCNSCELRDTCSSSNKDVIMDGGE